jgi:site-specific DNA-methyltransferase (adenine-specific)
MPGQCELDIDILPAEDATVSDALEWLAMIGDASVDLIVTDPPYSSLERHRAVGTTTRLRSWFPVVSNEYIEALMIAAWRVLRPNSHLYLMCDQATAFWLVPRSVDEVGVRTGERWTFWKAIVWDKVRRGTGYHYAASHEFILFFEKGQRQLNSRKHKDVLSVPRIGGEYPTEKPVELLRTLIENSTNPGDVVIDPFCGSGATGVAAVQCGRRFFGCDIEERAVDITRRRLEEQC